MVRLDRITMQGFKSFANRITIPFPVGFNVIAGPNGSGKSNVIDAITFVLGTTSARVIRAQKLQNLIFNGGKSRKPADFCEASLYLDNSDNKIPGEKELKVTRKITRSGISVYKLNGHTVTRTKVLDLLSYANLSPEGYNIIMQGDVTRVIEMSTIERRSVIDEISGIAEFDEKKGKAVKELEHVELRVRENMIIVAEKQKLVNRLKAEKESAEKYQKLEGELRKSKASLLKKRITEAEEKLSVLEKGSTEDTKKFEKLEKEFAKLESEIEAKEKALKKLGDEIISRSKNYEILRKIDTLQTDAIRKKDKIDLNSRELERLRAASEKSTVVQAILALNKTGVYGTISSLVDVPKRYETGVEVAIGHHASDIVVKDDEIATQCIKFLKEKKLGRARFIPLNKIKGRKKADYKGPEKIIGFAIDLVKFDKKYQKAMEYVLGNTIVVDNIDTAKKIDDFRLVTLDGDLKEKSGALLGGFYRKISRPAYSLEIKKLQTENEKIQDEIDEIEKELEKLKSLEKEESADVQKLQASRDKEDKLLEDMRKRRKDAYEERMSLQNNISKDRIERARIEAGLDNTRIEYEDYKDVTEFYTFSQEELQEKVRSAIIEINRLGPVNLRAIEEFDTLNVEFEELKKKLDKLLEEKDAIYKVFQDIEQRRYAKFMETFNSINLNYSKTYSDLSGGGIGRLRLEEENNIDSGLVIEASPVGKKILNLDVMSGGEKTLTSLAFLFAIMQHSASPFYILDEVDAALDKTNTNKIANLLKNYSKTVQFIVITHNDITIGQADKVFGVSMEDGVSRVFGVELPAV
jgi:chromosome segregation protein